MKRDIHNFNRRSRRRPALFVLWVTAQLGDIFPRAPLHGEEYAAVGAIRTSSFGECHLRSAFIRS